MPVSLKKQELRDGTVLLILLSLGLGLLLCGKQVSQATAAALELCLFVLLPSLFPFFVLSSLLISSGIVQRLAPKFEKTMQAFFGLPGVCIAPILLGVIGGYPVGARAAADLYLKGHCTPSQAERLLRFCNNAGPAFFIGVIGSSLLKDSKTGLLLWLIHLGAAFIISQFSSKKSCAVKAVDLTLTESHSTIITMFLQAVTGAFASFLNVCAFVILFAVVTRLLTATVIFFRLCSLLPGSVDFWSGLATGFLELTAGTATLSAARLPRKLLLPALSFLCGWGGISVQCQSVSLLRTAALPCRGYLRSKLLQGVIAATLTLLLGL